MAVPKSLKPIEYAKAQALIEKHTQNGTGHYEYDNCYGDFLFISKGQEYLLREGFHNNFEIGKVVY